MFIEYFINVWGIFLALSLWLVLGALIAGILHVFLPENFVARHLGGRGIKNTLKAVLFGVPMPLCSCGVIPAAIGLKKSGASDGASVGFLISTPQTGVDSILVSASFLGWPFAIFKVISAFITGIIGGVAVDVSSNELSVKKGSEEKTNHERGGIDFKHKVKESFHFAFGELIYNIWGWVVLGVFLSALISTAIPSGALGNSPFVSGFTGKIIILVFSMLLYVCATGSVPIAGALVAAGMPVGSALVFLMAGPATNIATMGAVYKVFGKKILAIYLLVISVGSVLLGHLFDTFFTFKSTGHDMAHADSNIFQICAAIFMIALLSWYAFTDIKFFLFKRAKASVETIEEMVFNVRGMSCEGCAKQIKNALITRPEIKDVSVNVSKGLVKVFGTSLSSETISEAIRAKGYKVNLRDN